MKLQLLAKAEADSKTAAEWYNKEREGLGDEFLDEVGRAMRIIERDPFRFARIKRPRTTREIRSYRLKRFPYSIVYERIDTEFYVVAIAHAKRRPSYWLSRKTDELQN